MPTIMSDDIPCDLNKVRNHAHEEINGHLHMYITRMKAAAASPFGVGSLSRLSIRNLI